MFCDKHTPLMFKILAIANTFVSESARAFWKQIAVNVGFFRMPDKAKVKQDFEFVAVFNIHCSLRSNLS